MTCGHAIDHPYTFAPPEFVTTFSIYLPLPSYSAAWSRKGSCPPLFPTACQPYTREADGR